VIFTAMPEAGKQIERIKQIIILMPVGLGYLFLRHPTSITLHQASSRDNTQGVTVAETFRFPEVEG